MVLPPVRGLVKLRYVPEGGVPALRTSLETHSGAGRVRWKGFPAGVPPLEGGLKSCQKPARRGLYHYFEHFLRPQVRRMGCATRKCA